MTDDSFGGMIKAMFKGKDTFRKWIKDANSKENLDKIIVDTFYNNNKHIFDIEEEYSSYNNENWDRSYYCKKCHLTNEHQNYMGDNCVTCGDVGIGVIKSCYRRSVTFDGGTQFQRIFDRSYNKPLSFRIGKRKWLQKKGLWVESCEENPLNEKMDLMVG